MFENALVPAASRRGALWVPRSEHPALAAGLGLSLSLGIGSGVAGAQAPATPLTIFGGLLLWYLDGDLGVDGGTGTWTDQANGHVWSPNGSPTYNATLLNGRGGFSYVRASSQRHSCATINLPAPGTTPTTLIGVVRQDAWNNLANVFGDMGGTNIRVAQNDATPELRQSAGTLVNENNAGTIGTWFVVIAEFSNAVTDRLKVGANNVSVAAAGNNTSTGRQIAASASAAHCSMSCVQHLGLSGIATPQQIADYVSFVTGKYGAVAA